MSRLNYARIVYRLLTSPRGWRLDELQEELSIAPRTWSKYRKVLEEEFEPFFQRGESRLEVVEEGGARWLRLAEPSRPPAGGALVARLAAYKLAALLLQSYGSGFREAVSEAFAALQRGRRDEAQRRLLARTHRDLDRLLYFRPYAAKDYSARGEEIETLLDALVGHERIELDYEAATGEARAHTLEPLTLALYQGGLYLLARYPEQPRVYNFVVDRITEVRRQGKRFSYPSASDYDPEQVLSASFGIFFHAKAGPRQTVRLSFASKRWLQTYLLERTWHPTQRFQQQPDGRLELEFQVSNLVEVAQWVRGFGEDVEVLSPAGLLET